MHIQVKTDHNIAGHQALIAGVSDEVEGVLSRFSDHITRVEVHLSDENGHKKGKKDGQADKRCMIETRLAGRQPIAVTHEATTLVQAIRGAADKLAKLIENTLGRLRDQKNGRTDPPGPDKN